MRFASPTLRLLLVCVLLLAQQQAVVHLLGHDLSQLSQRQDPADPKDAVCAKCLALAHLDHALGGDVPVVPVAHPRPDAPPAFDVATPDLAFATRYRTRAPPPLS